MEINIKIDENGQLHVNGPLNNKLVMLGALEMAKHVVLDYDPTKQPLVTPATMADLPQE